MWLTSYVVKAVIAFHTLDFPQDKKWKQIHHNLIFVVFWVFIFSPYHDVACQTKTIQKYSKQAIGNHPATKQPLDGTFTSTFC